MLTNFIAANNCINIVVEEYMLKIKILVSTIYFSTQLGSIAIFFLWLYSNSNCSIKKKLKWKISNEFPFVIINNTKHIIFSDVAGIYISTHARSIEEKTVPKVVLPGFVLLFRYKKQNLKISRVLVEISTAIPLVSFLLVKATFPQNRVIFVTERNVKKYSFY